MKFVETPLSGAFIVEQEPFSDARGYFARAYCKDELATVGANYEFVQANMSGNVSAGTLRGLHYQNETAPEAKFFRCINGAVFDVRFVHLVIVFALICQCGICPSII